MDQIRGDLIQAGLQGGRRLERSTGQRSSVSGQQQAGPLTFAVSMLIQHFRSLDIPDASHQKDNIPDVTANFVLKFRDETT